LILFCYDSSYILRYFEQVVFGLQYFAKYSEEQNLVHVAVVASPKSRRWSFTSNQVEATLAQLETSKSTKALLQDYLATENLDKTSNEIGFNNNHADVIEGEHWSDNFSWKC